MSMKTLEAAIIRELRALTKTPKLSMKSVMEWSTSEDVVRKGLVEAEEKLIHCPGIGVWAAVKKDALKEG